MRQFSVVFIVVVVALFLWEPPKVVPSHGLHPSIPLPPVPCNREQITHTAHCATQCHQRRGIVLDGGVP